MSFVEKLRKQPRDKKIRIIWICAAVVVVILAVLWVITWHYRKEVPADTTLFDTISRGVHDFGTNYNKPIK